MAESRDGTPGSAPRILDAQAPRAMPSPSPSPAPLVLWLVEDEPAYQTAFAELVDVSDDLRLDATFGAFADLAEALDRAPPWPDLLVMDIRLPGIDGIEATRRFRERASHVPVLVLTNVDDPSHVFEALQAGASGYVLKDRIVGALQLAVRQTARGGMGFSPGVAEHVAAFFAPATPSPLSPREEDVIRLMARGLSQKRIAEALFLSPHTVDTHVRHIYEKLHTSSGLEAVAIAARLQILDRGAPGTPRA